MLRGCGLAFGTIFRAAVRTCHHPPGDGHGSAELGWYLGIPPATRSRHSSVWPPRAGTWAPRPVLDPGVTPLPAMPAGRIRTGSMNVPCPRALPVNLRDPSSTGRPPSALPGFVSCPHSFILPGLGLRVKGDTAPARLMQGLWFAFIRVRQRAYFRALSCKYPIVCLPRLLLVDRWAVSSLGL